MKSFMSCLFRSLTVVVLVQLCVPFAATAQDNPERPRRGVGFGGPIELGPDDVAVYEAPPDGFKHLR